MSTFHSTILWRAPWRHTRATRTRDLPCWWNRNATPSDDGPAPRRQEARHGAASSDCL